MEQQSRRSGLPRARRTALALFLAATPLAAQTTTRDARDTTHAQSQAPFFTFKDALLAGGFVGATLVMIPLDRRTATALLDSSTQANKFFKHASTGVEYIASPGAYIIGGSLYAIGRVGKFDRVADL